MAEQKLNYFERRAIWEAHGKRCAYCGEPLSFSQLEIDHILPEALLGAPERWRLIREEQSLPAGFSLLGYENLQPSCRRCNSRKRADPFLPGRIAIELGVAGRAKRQINDLIDDFKKADQRDKLRFAIAGALGSGELSERDIHAIFSSARANEGIFRLSAPLHLFGDEPMGEISKGSYEQYLDQILSLSPEMHEGLRLVSDDDREVRARTVREYQQATGSGFYPLSNVEMQVATRMFERPLSILSILQTGSLAERSFMDDPRVGLADISLLPATLLFCTEDMTSDPNVGQKRASLEQKSIRDLISAGEAKITDVASDVLGVESDDCRTFMFEIMRADVNGDGVQDMVIHWGAKPIDGTLRMGSVTALTRRSHDEMFSEIVVGGEQTAG